MQRAQHGSATHPVIEWFSDLDLFSQFLLRNDLYAIIRTAIWTNMMRKFQRMALRAGDHMRHIEAQVMRSPAITPDSRNFSFR